jgi:hypothetical protein
LDTALHPDVDAVLKDLKLCSRRIEGALSTHRVELQVLERLYYKGKNQHRSALFWGRVKEMKKHACRLQEVDASDIVASLRSCFYGESVALKSA